MLSYVDDALPGITRRKLRGHWAYFDPAGERITDRDEIDRLNATAMPPAYVDCWFCPSPDGHIQAVGWDEKGRKQYRYHAEFRATQEAAKYDACADFGRALPLLRARVESDLTHRTLDKDAVVAAIVRLLDLGRVRVGNETYAKANNSFGATTLRTDHATVRGAKLKLQYVGKSGKLQQLTIEDSRLSRIARRCQDLPGQHLFQYLCPDGTPQPVGSADVNSYIKAATAGDFTAKNFRTWGASVIAYRTLVEAGEKAVSVKALLEPVAAALGNTPAIARKSYVHPALIDLAKSGEPIGKVRLPRATRYASPTERGLIAFLDQLGSAHCARAASA
ncbi:MAG TPA: DNA topoisomerase IB [Sphingomonas sp.]|jgi:DNA topoisomerase-1|uniref:DNA topoisomerase IB n=1 Tax=Sphingomonas sp. TaxID=28214 RepID=UPI002ED7DDBA